VVDAIMASGYDDVKQTVARADALMQAVAGEEFKLTAESFNRVCNLAAKAVSEAIDADRFEHDAERELFDRWTEVHEAYDAAFADAAEALAVLGRLQDPVNRFFDQVMVMAEDEAVRANRLALLANIASDIRRYADFSKLVWAS
jgi:glycyl-tRNA synthetase beta chain